MRYIHTFSEPAPSPILGLFAGLTALFGIATASYLSRQEAVPAAPVGQVKPAIAGLTSEARANFNENDICLAEGSYKISQMKSPQEKANAVDQLSWNCFQKTGTLPAVLSIDSNRIVVAYPG